MTHSVLETRPLDILTDGGSRHGVLVLSQGKLAAVLIEVAASETGRPGGGGGWYLEAGFGPCGRLLALQPEVFQHQADAIAWINKRLERAPR
jgi:hypothetical protein